MTREEAVIKLKEKGLGHNDVGIMLTTLEALGLIKFDEEKLKSSAFLVIIEYLKATPIFLYGYSDIANGIIENLKTNGYIIVDKYKFDVIPKKCF